MSAKTVCVVGASGKFGQYMVNACLQRGWRVHAVCRPKSVAKLARFEQRIRIFPGKTNDASVIKDAVRGCDAVLTVLVPWGVQDYASGTARAVLTHAAPEARLIFSCGWHISRDGKDRYGFVLSVLLPIVSRIARCLRVVDIEDQVRACRMIFHSERAWTVVRGCDLEEGPAEGLPLWRQHVGDPALASNRVRRIDFAEFMVAAVEDQHLIQQAPAIVGCKTESALAALE